MYWGVRIQSSLKTHSELYGHLPHTTYSLINCSELNYSRCSAPENRLTKGFWKMYTSQYKIVTEILSFPHFKINTNSYIVLYTLHITMFTVRTLPLDELSGAT